MRFPFLGGRGPRLRNGAATGADGAGAQALEDVGAADVATDDRIRSFLRMHEGLQCVVTRQGTCFVVAGQDRERVVRGLSEVVARRLGRVRVVAVSPLDYQIWQGARRAESVAARPDAAAERARNLSVEHVVGQAVDAGASDLYLDVLEKLGQSRLAFRTFGIKEEIRRFAYEEGDVLARAMWALGNATYDPSWTCDASFDIDHGGKTYRVRANSLREFRGNAIVCRVLDPSFRLPLEESGYSGVQIGHIRRMCLAPGGIVLVSGETNSGKSTTLGSLLDGLPRTQKIVAIEDPVEIVRDHVNHVQMDRHHSDAATRARKLLAALVRQNPDSLMVGEVRDAATAAAIQDTAIQGKRVFTTVHAQSCAASIPRLANLGVDRSLLGLASFLAGVINQNLVPVVCPSCGLDRHPDEVRDRRYRGLFGSGIRFRNEAGCDACRRGVCAQTLVAEVFPLCLDRGGEAQELIAAGRLAALERYMRETGVEGQRCERKHEHAAMKVRAGEIDPELTETIIGEFHRDDVASTDEVVGLQRAVS